MYKSPQSTNLWTVLDGDLTSSWLASLRSVDEQMAVFGDRGLQFLEVAVFRESPLSHEGPKLQLKLKDSTYLLRY